jgi:hypothetical protein
MARGGRLIEGRDGKMHPLFAELYLDGDPDDSAEAERESRTERARARARRSVLQRRSNRRA